MCIRKAVSSQLTGVVESPEETAAQPCPSAPGLFREPCTHNCRSIPVAWCSRQRPKLKTQDLKPPWVDRHRAGSDRGSSHHPVHLHGGPEASRNTHPPKLTACPTVFTWPYFCLPTNLIFLCLFFFFLALFLLFLFFLSLSTDKYKKRIKYSSTYKSQKFSTNEWNTKF